MIGPSHRRPLAPKTSAPLYQPRPLRQVESIVHRTMAFTARAGFAHNRLLDRGAAAQMPNSSRSLYSSAPIRALFARELAAIGPVLAGVYGNYGLLLQAHPDAPAELPVHLLGNMVTLKIGRAHV